MPSVIDRNDLGTDVQRREGETYEPLSVLSLINMVLRHVRLILVLPLLLSIVAVGVVILMPTEYVASSALKPQTSNPAASRLAGLAAQFGMGGIATGESDSAEFYAALLTSSDLLRATLLTEYEFAVDREGGDTIRATLLELYPRDEEDPREEQIRQAVKALRSQVAVNTELESGLVRLRAEAEWPDLAVGINRRMIELLQEFNIERRQSQASEERRFVEARLEEAREELRQAEDELKTFLERNRRLGDSPELNFQRNQLDRQLAFRQQIYTSLAESYEQARIDEVRNTPVITVVDQPEGSAERAGPGLVLVLLAALILGFGVAVLLAMFLESVERARSEAPGEYTEFERLRRGAVGRVLRPLRR